MNFADAGREIINRIGEIYKVDLVYESDESKGTIKARYVDYIGWVVLTTDFALNLKCEIPIAEASFYPWVIKLKNADEARLLWMELHRLQGDAAMERVSAKIDTPETYEDWVKWRRKAYRERQRLYDEARRNS